MNDEIDVPVYNFILRAAGTRCRALPMTRKRMIRPKTMLNLALRLWGQDIQLLAEGRPQYMLPFKIRWR